MCFFFSPVQSKQIERGECRRGPCISKQSTTNNVNKTINIEPSNNDNSFWRSTTLSTEINTDQTAKWKDDCFLPPFPIPSQINDQFLLVSSSFSIRLHQYSRVPSRSSEHPFPSSICRPECDDGGWCSLQASKRVGKGAQH